MNKGFIICGHSGAGKDTAASFMKGYTSIALADNILQLINIVKSEGIDAGLMQVKKYLRRDPPYKIKELLQFVKTYQEPGKKQRHLLQMLGTELRKIDDYVWINALKQKLKSNKKYVITDCRRIVELNAFPGWKSVFIDVSQPIRAQRLLKRDGYYDPQSENHEAEKEIDLLRERTNFYITNEGTLEQLEEKIKEILNRGGD